MTKIEKNKMVWGGGRRVFDRVIVSHTFKLWEKGSWGSQIPRKTTLKKKKRGPRKTFPFPVQWQKKSPTPELGEKPSWVRKDGVEGGGKRVPGKKIVARETRVPGKGGAERKKKTRPKKVKNRRERPLPHGKHQKKTCDEKKRGG